MFQDGNKYASFNNTERLLNPPKRNWAKRDINSFKGRKTIIKYNHFRMQNQSEILTKDQYQELGQIYRPDSPDPELTVKRFLKNEEVKEYANTELAKVLSDNNITLQFVVDKRKEILDKSIENKQFNASIKALEGLENHLGLNTKIKVTESRKYDNMNELKEVIQQVKQERSENKQENEEK